MKKFFVWILVLLVLVVAGFLYFGVEWKSGSLHVGQVGVKWFIPVVSEKSVDWENLSQNVVSVFAEEKISYLLEWNDIRPGNLRNVDSKVLWWTAFLFAYDDGAIFLTCKHVVADRDLKYFVDIQWKKYSVDKIWFHDDLDIALLQVKSIDLSSGFSIPFVWSQWELLLWDWLKIIWNLFGKYNNSITAWILSKKDISFSIEWIEYTGLYMVDALFGYGSSWSPVFNDVWELIAIAVAHNSDGLGFVLPISEQEIKKFYESVFSAS